MATVTRKIIKHKHWYSGALACAIQKSEDSGIWWGFIGVEPTHPLHGSIFKKLSSDSLYKVVMKKFNNRALDEKWWFGFEGSYSAKKTKDRVMAVAKECNSIYGLINEDDWDDEDFIFD